MFSVLRSDQDKLIKAAKYGRREDVRRLAEKLVKQDITLDHQDRVSERERGVRRSEAPREHFFSPSHLLLVLVVVVVELRKYDE